MSNPVNGYDGLILDGEERDFGIPELMLSLTSSITGTDRAGLEDKENKYRAAFLLGMLEENPDEALDIQSKYAIFLNSPKHPLTSEQYEFVRKYYNNILAKHNYKDIVFKIKRNRRNSLLYYLEITATKTLNNKTSSKLKSMPALAGKPIPKNLANNLAKFGLMSLSARYNLYCVTANEISKKYYNDLLNTKLKLNAKIISHEFRATSVKSSNPNPPLMQHLLKHYSDYILAERNTDKSFFIIAVNLDSPKQLILEMLDGHAFADNALFSIDSDLIEQDKIAHKKSL